MNNAAKRTEIFDLIASERERQIEEEGYSPKRDDGYVNNELALAAAAYCVANDSYVSLWPWAPKTFKPRGRRRNLVRAAALIVAEIERIDRA